MSQNQLSAAKILKLLQKRIKEHTVDANFGEAFLNPYTVEQQIKNLESTYDVHNKLGAISSRQSGIVGKINTKIITKLYWIIRNTLSPVLESQQRFNKGVIDTTKVINSNLIRLKEEVGVDINLYNIIDYHGFEDENRGSEELVLNKQELYLKYFINKKNVLDVGCGRGEFLELLKKNDISAKGIELSDDFVEHCRLKGLDVEKADVVNYLDSIPNHSLGGLIALQVVEHLQPAYLLQFIKLAEKKLAHDAYIILETINPQSLIVFAASYYKDLTHEQPIHPAVLQFALKSAGFEYTEVVYSGEVFEKDKLCLLSDTPENSLINDNFQKLNHLLYGPQDYAIIGKKIRKDSSN